MRRIFPDFFPADELPRPATALSSMLAPPLPGTGGCEPLAMPEPSRCAFASVAGWYVPPWGRFPCVVGVVENAAMGGASSRPVRHEVSVKSRPRLGRGGGGRSGQSVHQLLIPQVSGGRLTHPLEKLRHHLSYFVSLTHALAGEGKLNTSGKQTVGLVAQSDAFFSSAFLSCHMRGGGGASFFIQSLPDGRQESDFTMSWTDVFPVLSDDQVAECQALATKEERGALGDCFGVLRVENRRDCGGRLVATPVSGVIGFKVRH